jgi:hypothetical protein
MPTQNIHRITLKDHKEYKNIANVFKKRCIVFCYGKIINEILHKNSKKKT